IKVDKRINYFNLESNVFKLKKDLNYDKSKSNLINALEDSYNIYIRYRNNLFHYELSNKYDDSFVITNKSKLFKIFDKIYSCFKEV
ncbi:MAG: hypothetical protein K2I49_00420, partial [Ureaplasma sp.]|nr:hypothetical protein [Ureaplasma sp.]